MVHGATLRHGPILGAIRDLCGEYRRLQALGLRPESRIGIVDREVIEQRIDGHVIAHTSLLPDGNEPQRGVSHGRRVTQLAAQKQPGPLELMTRLNDPSCKSAGGTPRRRKTFADSAAVLANEAR